MKLQELLQKLYEHRQLFLTGAGGTGKSYSIKTILTKFKAPLLLGSTNMSAQHIGGDTIHSFFNLGIAKNLKELEASDREYYNWYCQNVKPSMEAAKASRLNKISKTIPNTDIIVIDEISMVSAQTLDLMFHRIKQAQVNTPLIVFIGDLYQLPPVSTDKVEKQLPVFKSKYWKPYIIELTEIKRTENVEFAKAQQHLRKGKYTRFAHDILQSIAQQEYPDTYNPTVLCPTNQQADKINQEMLAQLDTKEQTYKARVISTLKPNQTEKAIQTMPPELNLTLKEQSKVMFIATNKEEGFYNGMRATIIELCTNSVLVKTDTGNEIEVKPFEFTKKKVEPDRLTGEPTYITEVSITQIPLRPAYALTIHKAQGMSISELRIDCSRIFESGQFYVAISRAIDPTLLQILNFDKKYARIPNPEIDKYLESAQINKTTEITQDLVIDI